MSQWTRCLLVNETRGITPAVSWLGSLIAAHSSSYACRIPAMEDFPTLPPTEEVEAKKKRRKRRRLVAVAVGMLILLVVDYFAYPYGVVGGRSLNRGENALWLRYTWY